MGVGSTFTLFLPHNQSGFVHYELPPSHAQIPVIQSEVVYTDTSLQRANADVATVQALPEPDAVSNDDRSRVAPGEAAVLIVTAEEATASILLEQAHAMKFKGIVAHQGASTLTLARDYQPVAILLDVDLPEIDGFTVLERLKRDSSTCHIPIHVLTQSKERERALRLGAFSYLHKPVEAQRLQEEFLRIRQFLNRTTRRLLVVEDNQVQREAIVGLLAATDVEIVAVGSGGEALDALKAGGFDCMVLDLGLPDMSGFTLLTTIGDDVVLRNLPVVVYTGRELSRKEVTQLKRIAKTVVLKDARSPERLLDETALFLHRSPLGLPEVQRRMLEDVRVEDGDLAGRTVLIVDDDLRNIFALSSVLERQQMKVLFAENGRDGIEVLEKDPSIEIVLMDIMMPEMDGYDTMRAIREIPKFRGLPIITLTAKAMKGDRDKCLAAGASVYITKPVDVAQLLSLMWVWLHS